MKEFVILIADDEIDTIELIVEKLEASDIKHKVIRVTNGQILCQMAKKRLPDLIITDWEMPVMNGIEAIKQLKLDKSTSLIPIIMCTGIMTSSENLQIALESGAVDYIRKPIDPIELIARVKSMLYLSDSLKAVKAEYEKRMKIFQIIAHDLRGPVGGLSQMTEILGKESLNDETLHYWYNLMKQTASSTFSLLENLLSWANIQRGTLLPKPEIFDIRRSINEVFNVLSTRLNEKQINFISDVIEPVFVSADFVMVTTILRNLVSNSIKFSHPKKNIRIFVEIEHEFCNVSVADSGVGIKPETIDLLLNNDGFITTYGTENEKGSGLGLSICKEFIELNNGRLTIESEENNGSRFSFSLPLAQNTENKKNIEMPVTNPFIGIDKLQLQKFLQEFYSKEIYNISDIMNILKKMDKILHSSQFNEWSNQIYQAAISNNEVLFKELLSLMES
jgi:signal transduction histidine kinase